MMGSICLLPKLEGLGGPASFHASFARLTRARGVNVHHDPMAADLDSILVIGGTRHLQLLWQARRRGIKVVQRLAGMNWIQRKRRTGMRHYLRAEVNNLILAFIRRYLADEVIYQSQFVTRRWNEMFGEIKAPTHVIYNGVDLTEFTVDGPEERPTDHTRLLVVEGRLRGGYELGLENAAGFARRLDEALEGRVELMIAAEVDPAVQAAWSRKLDLLWVNWAGVVPREQIPFLDRSAHLFFSADINHACPNSVIEALACGLPVVSFSTGSLPELVSAESGKLTPYGQNFESLGPPDFEPLVQAAQEILDDQEKYRRGARQRAVEAFDQEEVVNRYLSVLL